MSDGEVFESYPVKLWGVDGLEFLREGGEDLTIARLLLAFEEAGESYLLINEWTRIVALRVADLGPAAPELRPAVDLIAAYPADGHTIIFGSQYGRMRALSARRVQAGGSAVSLLELRWEPTASDTSGSLWSTVVELNGRPVLLSATDAQVHVWDVIELLGPKGFPAVGAPTISGVASLAARGDSLFLGTEAGSVLAWDRFGDQLWSRDLTSGSIRSLAVGAGGAELLAGSADGMIHRLDTATGGKRHPSLAAGSGVRALVVRPTARGEQVFAAIDVRGPTGKYLHFGDTWGLPDATEIPTWNSAAGPEVLRDASAWKENDNGANGFKPELALKGYYRWKTLYALTVFELGGRTVVALAGPHGEVRVVDAGALREVVSWVGGRRGDYVHSLFGGVLGGLPYVFGGDEKGVLFRGGITIKKVDLRQRLRAHQGRSPRSPSARRRRGSARLRRRGRMGPVLDPDLEPVDEINAGRPVTSLVWLGDDLVIATDRGVLCVKVRWQAVFGAT